MIHGILVVDHVVYAYNFPPQIWLAISADG